MISSEVSRVKLGRKTVGEVNASLEVLAVFARDPKTIRAPRNLIIRIKGGSILTIILEKVYH